MDENEEFEDATEEVFSSNVMMSGLVILHVIIVVYINQYALYCIDQQFNLYSILYTVKRSRL